MFNKYKKDKIEVEVSTQLTEKFLNELWENDIPVENIKPLDITTIKLEVNYEDYLSLEKAVKKCKGKMRVVGRRGFVFTLMRLKRQISIVIGIFIFVIVLFILSNKIWSVEITTEENVSPYVVRKELAELGVKPGVNKKDMDVYDLEEKLKTMDGDILWIRARIEGSTLKVTIEEKVNPPKLTESARGECIAKKSGEIKRIYVSSGTALVKPGDIVKEGDVLINGIQGKEGEQYAVPAKGTVIANTFYEKEMEITVKGSKLERTGEIDKDIFLNILGKKIYLKKAINKFQYYDRIEDNNGFMNTVTYYERDEKDVDINKEEAVEKASKDLEGSLTKSLSNDAKICSKDIYVEEAGDGVIIVRVMFSVEENIGYTAN